MVKVGSDGRITRLKDVARVELGAADYSTTLSYNGHPAVGLAVFQLPGTNAINTANAIYAKLRELKRRFPPGLDYAIAHDTTPFVRESIRDVIRTLLIAVGLVALVVLVFLQNWRAALVPILAIPVSLIGTFAVMWLMHSPSICCRCSAWCWRSASWWMTRSWWSKTSSAGWNGD